MHVIGKIRSLLTCCLTLAVFPCAASADSLVAMLPNGAYASGELENGADAIERLRQSEWLSEVVQSELYQHWANSPDGRRVRGGRAVLEGQLGMNLWEAATQLVGHRVALGLYPPTKSRQPEALLLIEFRDESTSELIREKGTPWVEIAAEQVISRKESDTWLLETRDGKASAALRDRWLVLASTMELRDAALKRLSGESSESLSAAVAWQTAATSTPPRVEGEARLTMVLDIDAIPRPDGKDRLIPGKMDNPLGSLLLGGLSEALAVSPSLSSTLSVSESGFSWRVRTASGRESVDASHQTLLTAVPGPASAIPTVPRQLGGFTICRDWANWYRQRDQLIEARVLPEFDKFETGLSTFLPGKDFAEDVLALVGAPMRFVVASQTYEHIDGRPGMQLPAVGVIIELNDPERGTGIFQLFFQTIATIINIEAGKGGRQPWVMHSESHDEVQISFAKYLDRPQGENLPIVFNFQPAAGLVGKHYVAATSLELCRDLVTALKQPESVETDRTSDNRNFVFTLDPAAAGELLAANSAIINARKVQGGQSLEQSEKELETFLGLLQRLTPVTLKTDVTNDSTVLTLEGGWK